jgi:DNA-binding transcriptional MerR regulator
MRELLQIGEVAKLIGISSKTIRYYHEIGLLAEPRRTDGGYWLYTAQDLLRLQRIRRLRSLGLHLDCIKAEATRRGRGKPRPYYRLFARFFSVVG